MAPTIIPAAFGGGGALKLDAAGVADPTTFVLRNSTVARSYSNGAGGGIFVGAGCSLEILDCGIEAARSS
jgi:hypothetical protein